MYEDIGNKCGKCQNHDFEVLKKGHARDCPFKKCNCLKCGLLDARSDILQVISGKETKLKGTKKDPNCGFCQNHGVKILRKGHVRSCGFGQERHFKLDNCFDCEVHFIRNEVNRLQIKMRRAMKEDRTLSEEQRKTAREAITREEVEKVREMARIARERREDILSTQQTRGETSAGVGQSQAPTSKRQQQQQHHQNVWRPWSQHQVGAAAQLRQQQAQHLLATHHHHHHQRQMNAQQQQQQHYNHNFSTHLQPRLKRISSSPAPQQQQQTPQIPRQQRLFLHQTNNHHHPQQHSNNLQRIASTAAMVEPAPVQPSPPPYTPQFAGQDLSLNGLAIMTSSSSPPAPLSMASTTITPTSNNGLDQQPLSLVQQQRHANLHNHQQQLHQQQQQQQELLNTLSLFRLIAQFVQTPQPQS